MKDVEPYSQYASLGYIWLCLMKLAHLKTLFLVNTRSDLFFIKANFYFGGDVDEKIYD